MSRLISLILICVLLLRVSYQQNSKDIDINPEIVLNKLLEKYEKVTELPDRSFLDQEIDTEYLKIFQKLFQISLLDKFDKINISKTDSEIFNGLEEIYDLKLPEVKDMSFFKNYNGYEQWFLTTLTPDGVIVFQINRNQISQVASHNVPNASKIHVLKYEESIIFIVQESQSITVLFFVSEDGSYMIQEIQKLEVSEIKDVSIWRFLGQLFIGILTPGNLQLYTESSQQAFELIKTYRLSASFISLFQTANASYLISSDPKDGTTLLEHRGRSVIAISTISRGFLDAAALKIPSGDYFVALAGLEDSIVYRFLESSKYLQPFQMIGPAAKMVALKERDGREMFMLLKEDGTADVYQYDGWKFARVNFKLLGLEQAKVLAIEGEERLLVEWLDRSWSLNSIKWTKKAPMHSMYEAKQWCLNAIRVVKKMPETVPESNFQIRTSNGKMIKLEFNNTIDQHLQKLKNLTNWSAQLHERLSVVNESLNQAKSAKDPHFSSLRAEKVRVSCSDRCTAENLVTELPCNFTDRAGDISTDQDLSFDHVIVDRLDGLPVILDGLPLKMCPSVGIKLKDVKVKGSINGISFDDLVNDTLKTSGDQVVTGQHTFQDLRVEAFSATNIDLASNSTHQRVKTDSITAEELILTDGGILLPLNGEPTTMTGELSVSKAKLDGTVHLQGSLKGENVKRFQPMVEFPAFRQLRGNYTLNNVRIKKSLTTEDLARMDEGRTFKEVAEGAVKLDEEMPVRLEFLQNRTIWSNVTAPSLPRWLCRNNSETVRVTGKKIAPKSVTLANSIISKLPPPKIRANLCSDNAETPDLKTSSIRVKNATAKVVESEYVYGAKRLEEKMMDSVTSLDEVNLSEKDFTGFVHVEHLNISDFANSPFYSFKQTEFKWNRPDTIEGPIKVKDLQVGSLNALKGIKIPSLSEIRNMIVEGNLQVKTINGIDFDEFLEKFVRINDTAFLKNVSFEGSLEVDEIQAENTNVDLESTEQNIHLGNKVIFGDLEVEDDLSIPNILAYPPEDEVKDLVVDGSIRFEYEPEVEYINGRNLDDLLAEIWMDDRTSNLTGMFLVNNFTLFQPNDFFNLLNTPKYGSWKDLEKRLLSKTKSQYIQVPVHFNDAKIPNIITQGNSSLRSSDQYLNDLLHMTLKKNENQVIQDNWHFDEIIVEDNLTLHGKINNLNLSSDVARYNVDVNRVTGKKVVNELTVRNLTGLNFGNWAKDAFIPSDTNKTILINGEKTFDTIHARILNVTGNVMGKNLSECLLKTGDQIITAPKVLKGSLHAPSLSIKGLINDVNITDLESYRMRSSASEQRVKSKMIFNNTMEILGDLEIKGKYQDVDLKKLNKINDIFAPAVRAITYLKPFATGIETVIKNRAKYWDKFEYVNENILLTVEPLRINFTLHFHLLGDCIIVSLSELVCDHQHKYPLKTFPNTTEVLINQMLSIDGEPLVVQVTSGSRSRITIFQYDYLNRSFYIAKSVRAPGIIQASILSDNRGVWIALRLKSEMMLLRFEVWGDLQKYHLPDSRLFALDRVPATDEPILVREDGMWKLEGLAGPRNWFKVSLKADKIETLADGNEFFVRLICKSSGTKLLRARYVGD